MGPRFRAALVRVLIALAVIGAIAWWFVGRSTGTNMSSASTGSAAPAGGGRVVPVQLARVETKDMPIWIEGLGTVAAFQQVTVRAQVDGLLERVMFTEGQVVKRGDVLAQIDSRPWQIQLQQAQGALTRDKAQYDTAKRNYQRYKQLKSEDLVAQQRVDEYAGQVGQFAGSVRMNRAAIDQAKLMLDYAEIKAPLDGITGMRLVDAGNVIKANDPTGLVVITAVDPAAVMFTIPQDRLTSVTSAQARGAVPVEIWNRDGSEKLAEGKLAVLDNQINTATATLRLKALADNPKRTLWPNAFVKARMLVETRKGALVIPAVALQRGPQGTFVYTLNAEKVAVMKPVTVSLLTGDHAIIATGLAAGDQVVVEGQNQLRPGGKAEPIDPKQNKPGANSPKAEAKPDPKQKLEHEPTHSPVGVRDGSGRSAPASKPAPP